MTHVRLSGTCQVVSLEDVRRELDLTPDQLFEVFATGGSRPLSVSRSAVVGMLVS